MMSLKKQKIGLMTQMGFREVSDFFNCRFNVCQTQRTEKRVLHNPKPSITKSSTTQQLTQPHEFQCNSTKLHITKTHQFGTVGISDIMNKILNPNPNPNPFNSLVENIDF